MPHYCHMLSSYFRKEQTQFLLQKLVRYISDKSVKDSKVSQKFRKKPKIVTMKKSITPDKQHISVIEWKTASSVIKRLNWENSHLFGPLQSVGPAEYDSIKMEESNKIIQHSTEIPVREPITIHTDVSDQSMKSSNLETILTFPLENKSVALPGNNGLREQIDELNTLRKYIETLVNSSVPSVTHILEMTRPPDSVEALNRWKQKMIRQLGVEGFKKYQKDLLADGASLHECISSFLDSTPETKLQIKEKNIGHWKSLQHVFPTINDVKLLEEVVRHPFLCYTGVVDCFAKYKQDLVVIEWKTSKKSKLNHKGLYDYPLQIAAYVGALNFDPKYQYLASKGLIVVAYNSGEPADVYFYNDSEMRQYWREWLQRVKQFWEIKISEKESS